MPPLLVYAAAAVLVGLGMRFVKNEWRRVNGELDRSEQLKSTPQPETRHTLKKDPHSGEWRLR